MIKRLLDLKRIRILVLIPITLFILLIVKLSPWIAEYIFARGIYKIISLPIGFVTGFLPFSLAEIIILLIPLFIIVSMIFFIRSLIKNKSDIWFTLCKGIVNVLCVVSIIFFSFMILCGTNYYRYDFEKYCDFEVRNYTDEELYNMCTYLAKQVNISKSEMKQVDEGFYDIADKCKDAMKNLAKMYPVLKYSSGSAKQVLLSKYMSYGGIVGIYIPFTVEANVNTDVLDYNRPVDTCHELAHMRGFMKEDEANYIAYLACINEGSAEFAYSGYMLALIHSTNQLYKYDIEKYYSVMEMLSDDVKGELVTEREYWDEIKESEVAKKADEVMTSVNNSYLELNGQENGVKSYGMMVNLLLAEYLSK